MELIFWWFLLNRHEEKIDSSAEALRVYHHLFIFPSENQFCNNATRVIARIKLQKMAFIQSL
jgi:hypothetical protein